MNSFLTCQFSSVTHKVLNLDESEYGISLKGNLKAIVCRRVIITQNIYTQKTGRKSAL